MQRLGSSKFEEDKSHISVEVPVPGLQDQHTQQWQSNELFYKVTNTFTPQSCILHNTD